MTEMSTFWDCLDYLGHLSSAFQLNDNGVKEVE